MIRWQGMAWNISTNIHVSITLPKWSCSKYFLWKKKCVWGGTEWEEDISFSWLMLGNGYSHLCAEAASWLAAQLGPSHFWRQYLSSNTPQLTSKGFMIPSALLWNQWALQFKIFWQFSATTEMRIGFSGRGYGFMQWEGIDPRFPEAS